MFFAQYSIEYVTQIGFAALHYKIGFVCNDFAQLGADVGVLSTLHRYRLSSDVHEVWY